MYLLLLCKRQPKDFPLPSLFLSFKIPFFNKKKSAANNSLTNLICNETQQFLTDAAARQRCFQILFVFVREEFSQKLFGVLRCQFKLLPSNSLYFYPPRSTLKFTFQQRLSCVQSLAVQKKSLKRAKKVQFSLYSKHTYTVLNTRLLKRLNG